MIRKGMFRLTGWLVIITMGAALGAPSSMAHPPTADETGTVPNVLAVETFLADIAQNVAGDRLEVQSLIPVGVDPHAFEPAPGDIRRIVESDVLIVNGAGLEEFLAEVLENAGGERQVIEAASGLPMRTPEEGEMGQEDEQHDHEAEVSDSPGEESEQLHHHEGDPHFWLDPNCVETYVQNIRDGLSQADPGGAATYATNAEAYIAQLRQLDLWITDQVQQVPVERRLLVTNHESFGYFADRYGFLVVGTILPSVSTGASPSAQQMAQLIDHIRQTGAPAIFLETGTNPQLAQQIAQEAGVKVVTELYSHSTTEADGPAPTYIEMMRYNTRTIVDALK